MSDVEYGGMPWPETGATHYHAQLGLPDKGSIKKLMGDVCNYAHFKARFGS